MISDTEFWIETAAIFGACIFLPFYAGYIHLSISGGLLYVLAAGVGLTAGDLTQFPPMQPFSFHELMMDIGLHCAAVFGIGSLLYFVALIFF